MFNNGLFPLPTTEQTLENTILYCMPHDASNAKKKKSSGYILLFYKKKLKVQ